MKQDKAEKIIKKAELKAQKAAKQVETASKKAEIAKQKQAAQAQKKAAKAADAATKKAAKKTKRAEAVAKKAQLAAKKAEEKKAKAVAKAAARATAEPAPAAEGEEGAPPAKNKKKDKKKLILIAVPVLAVAVGVGAFFFLKGGGKEEAPPEPIAAPAEYVLNEAHIAALPVWGEEVLVYQEEVLPEPEKSEEGEDGEEAENAGAAAEAEEAVPKTLYRYENLQNPTALVSAYTMLMTTEDAGFSTVDETLLRIDPPEEFGSSGSVQLARNVPTAEDGTGGGVHSLLLNWSGTTCSVTLDTPEGRVRDPKPETSASAAAPTRRGLSDIQALHPSKLGLAGDSMDAYTLMPQEGSVLIAGNPNPCMRINVYDTDSQIAGSYFLSSDGRLYKLDENANAVMELDWD